MSRIILVLMRFAAIFAAVLGVACTGGRVIKNGSPVAGANVSIWTCETTGKYVTATDASGVYQFNPFSADSSSQDVSKFIPPGPIAIMVTSSEGSSVTRKKHEYEGCPIMYNGTVQELPCKVHNINLVPMTLPKFVEESLTFFEKDCGLKSQVAQVLSAAAIGRDPASLPFTAGEPSAIGCLTQCSDSCLVPDVSIDEYSTCMCICVEVECGVSFGPFCTETAPLPHDP